MNTLIVDDSKAMRMLVRRTLRQAGFEHLEVEEAEDGAEALERLRTGDFKLVLSDWNMPNMNGLELLEAVKSEGIRCRFGFVTSESSAEMRSKALEAGALFLIAKPFTPQSFEFHLSDVVAGV